MDGQVAAGQKFGHKKLIAKHFKSKLVIKTKYVVDAFSLQH